MSREELGHGKSPHPVLAKDIGHLGFRGEELLVLRVLEVVLQLGSKLLDTLSSGGFLLANNFGQIGGELHGLGETGSFARHVES